MARVTLASLGTAPEMAVGGVYGDILDVGARRRGGVASEERWEERKRVFKATGVGDGK